MITNKNKVLVIQRIFIFVILYMIFSGVLENVLRDDEFVRFYTFTFLLFLFLDIIAHIIYIIKDFGVLKLFVVIQNLLIKIMYIVVALTVIYTRYYADNTLSKIFLGVVILGLLTYPIFIMFFLLDTYKAIEVSINKPLLLVLINGLVVYLLGFMISTEYKLEEVYLQPDLDYLYSFDFKYGLGLLYIPFVIAMIVYVISLFKSKKETILK